MNDDLDVAFADYEAALGEMERAEGFGAEEFFIARDAALFAEWRFLVAVDQWVSECMEAFRWRVKRSS